MAWKIIDRDDTAIRMINPETGVIKKVPFASEAQMALINKLRAELNMPPARSVPPLYRATKSIEALKRKLSKQSAQQKLV